MMADQRASLQQLAERTVSELNKPLNQAISGGAALVALCLAFKPHETLQFFGVVGLEITLLTRLLRYVSPGAAVRDLDDLSAAAQRKVSSTLSKATWRGVEQLDKKPGASQPLKERTASDNSAPVAAAAAAPVDTSANAAAAAAAPGDTSANAAARRGSATSTVAKAEPVPAATGSPALIDDAGTAKPVSASTPRTSVEAPDGDGSSTDSDTTAKQDGAVTLGSGDKAMEVSSAKAFVGAPKKSVVKPGFGKDGVEDGSGKGRASGVVELRESGPVAAPLGSVTASEDAGSRRAEASDTGLNKGATGSEGAQKATSGERKVGEVMGSLFGSFGRATSASASSDDKEKSTVQGASSGLSPSSQMPATPVDASKEVKRGIFGSFGDKANTLKEAARKGGSGIGGIFGSFGADRSTAAAKSGGSGATNSVFSAFGKSKSLATEGVDGGAFGGFRNAVSGREGIKREASSTLEQGVADAKAQGPSTVAVEKEKEENAPAAKTGLAAGASGTPESTRKAGSGRTPDADASPQASQSTISTTKPTIPSPSAASSNGVPRAESKLAIALRSEGARSGSVEDKNSAGSATGAQAKASGQQPIDKGAQTKIPTMYATSVESKAASGSEGKKVGSAAEVRKGVSALSADKSKGKEDLSEMQDALRDGNKGGADAKSITTAENRSSMGSSLPGATNTHSTKSDPVKSTKTASGAMGTEAGKALDTSMAKIGDEAEALGNREKGPEAFGSEGSSRRRSRAAAALEAAAILSGSDATPVPKPEVTPMASSGTAFDDPTQHTVAKDGKVQSNGNGRRIASATTGRSGAEGNGKKASDKGE
jgi:hypothetical protein